MTIWYVDPVGGSDSNGGTATSDAFLSLQYALSNGATNADDQVIIMGTTAAIYIDAGLTTTSTSMYIMGASSTGNVDGTRIAIYGPTSDYHFNLGAGTLWLYGLTLYTRGTPTGMISHAGGMTVYASNVEFDGNNASSYLCTKTSGGNCPLNLYGCTVRDFTLYDNNADANRTSPNYYSSIVVNTPIRQTSAATRAYNCIFSGSDFTSTAYGAPHILVHCILYDSIMRFSDRARSAGGGNPFMIIDSIFMNSPNAALVFYSGGAGNERGIVDRCLFYNNTSGSYSGKPESAIFTATNIEEQDPLFTDPNNEDFTIPTSSPAYRAASDGSNIGVTTVVGVSSGTTIIPSKLQIKINKKLSL